MPIDINGTVFKSSNTALNITSNSIMGLDINNGIPIQPHRPYFMATDNYSGWYSYVAGSWQDIVLNTVVVDNLNNYNPSNGIFTAPITGTYHFQASTYSYKNPSSNSDSYVHPIFRVNGSYSAKQASQTTPYRLRMRTYYSGGYTGDTQINELFYLTAGDYVTFHHYCSQSLQWYGNQSFFSGLFIG